jgi:hypothetical protein
LNNCAKRAIGAKKIINMRKSRTLIVVSLFVMMFIISSCNAGGGGHSTSVIEDNVKSFTERQETNGLEVDGVDLTNEGSFEHNGRTIYEYSGTITFKDPRSGQVDNESIWVLADDKTFSPIFQDGHSKEEAYNIMLSKLDEESNNN